MTLSTRCKSSPMILGPFALLVLLGAGACDRTYMSASHGRAYRSVFARQAVDPLAGDKPRNAKLFNGLDSQEARIVAQTYRKGLAPKEGAPPDQPMVVVAPRGAAREGGNMPPPSVPDR